MSKNDPHADDILLRQPLAQKDVPLKTYNSLVRDYNERLDDIGMLLKHIDFLNARYRD